MAGRLSKISSMFLHIQPRNAHNYTTQSTSYAQAVGKNQNNETIYDFTLQNSIPSQNIDNFCRLEKLIEK